MLVLFGVIAIAFGLMAFESPISTAASLTWAFGVMSIVEGVTSLFAMTRGNIAPSKGWLVTYAVASIAYGIGAVALPLLTAEILLVFLACWLIFAGVFRIVFAIRVRKEIEGEWLVGLSGFAVLVLGGLFLANPLIGVSTVTIWLGAASLVYGCMQIAAGFRLRKLA